MNMLIQVLASKEMSLFCFVLNCILVIGAFAEGKMAWLLFSSALAVLCLNNYYIKLDREEENTNHNKRRK
jgi:hypothetical protein